jgi:hypothetical protein
MSKFYFFLIITAISPGFYSAVSQNFQSLNYIESSGGLIPPQWESGNTGVAMADINQDGNIDILSIGDHGCPNVNSTEHGIMVWFGNGSGSWTNFMYGNFGYGGICVGDINNDGKMDAGFGMHHNYATPPAVGSKILEVALGDGTGMNWSAYDDSLATHGETWGMFHTDFGDVDNDGLLDLGSISFGCCAGIHIYKNLGTGTWRQTFGFTGGNAYYMGFVFGDINNDGNLDFAAGHQYGAVYFGDGHGYFTLMQNNLPSPGTYGYRGVSLGDVDNDGAEEIAFTLSGAQQVWKWNNTGQNWVNLSANLPASGSFAGTQLFDMNGDGFCDLVAFGSGLLKVWAGDGGTSWTEIASINLPSPGDCAALKAGGDADHNGFPDIVTVSDSGSSSNARNKIKFWKESSTPSILSIRAVYPHGSEKIIGGSVRFIDWLSAVPGAASSRVKLEFSSTGSGGPWTLLHDSLPNNGRYQWITPDNINSTNCYIRYIVTTSFSATGITPAPFILLSPIGIKTGSNIPDKFALYQNYPNPFNTVTKIKFDIQSNVKREMSNVRLTIYDLLGREVTVIVNQQLTPGTYEVEWDGTNYPSGVYFYRLYITGGTTLFTNTKKMVLLK